ncbi:MAG TPA: spermidine synthase [Stackebrandtia sp.]|uniref:spermidine synthase n=1 Tax=Stackebrandtia sp. TaxID=2023065 RepID=UPI002D4192DF|nr:spermidine synthase [Stackebrandtia sp.]HZE40168.1 spermidine synthase [Stackebrandtia sp.]
MGAISLRRRFDPVAKTEVHEVKLDEEFLMSSLFTSGEIELSRLGLARLPGGDLDVVVGGLGLGYTAVAALDDARVASVSVVEALGQVIDWHRRRLLPVSAPLLDDRRTRLIHGDFFALAATPDGFDPDTPARKYHAVLLDIDHSPRQPLAASHTDFYTPEGLRRLRGHLHPGGVFGLWSNDPPDDDFTETLAQVFDNVEAEVVTFANPLRDGDSSNTIYIAQ